MTFNFKNNRIREPLSIVNRAGVFLNGFCYIIVRDDFTFVIQLKIYNALKDHSAAIRWCIHGNSKGLKFSLLGSDS